MENTLIGEDGIKFIDYGMIVEEDDDANFGGTITFSHPFKVNAMH